MQESMNRDRLEESLARLGIEELEERLELSPVVPGGEESVDGAGCCGVCTCEIQVNPFFSGR